MTILIGMVEIENVRNDKMLDLQFHLCQQMLLLYIKCHCTFYIYGSLGKKAFCRISAYQLNCRPERPEVADFYITIRCP